MTTPPAISVTISVGTTGAVPTPPATLNATLINYVTATNPGYTVLPAALVEDWASTSVAAIAQMDSAAIDLINSVTPYSANAWIVTQLGNMYGVPYGVGSNTSAFVQFTGTVGYVIAKDFLVSDGTYQYRVADGGVIGSGGVSPLLFCVATLAGSWAVPPNTVTALITSVPVTVTLSVTNPQAGLPAVANQTEAQYRAQVLQAGLSPAQGMPSLLRTELQQITGVQARLISVVQINGGGWEVIVGGGDPYEVAGAIFAALFDISALVGSTTAVTGVTNANPGVVTTNLNHGLVTGQANVHIAGVVGMSGVNGGPYTVTVVDEKNFSFGHDTTSSGAYASGGVVTPNTRNISVNLIDDPDTYTIVYVNPPQQTVQIQLTWNTSSPNIVSPSAVEQLGKPALANYVMSIPVGSPLNEFEMERVFTQAISPLVPSQFLDRMVFTVSINGVSTPPLSGTAAIYGDPESYFYCVAADVAITQG